MKIEDIKSSPSLRGLDPATIGSVVAVVPIAQRTVQIIYKTTEPPPQSPVHAAGHANGNGPRLMANLGAA